MITHQLYHVNLNQPEKGLELAIAQTVTHPNTNGELQWSIGHWCIHSKFYRS
jgi:hypothetical protein